MNFVGNDGESGP